jgi:aspartate ammonia-lyase
MKVFQKKKRRHKNSMRLEKDSIGTVKIPKNALYGIQSVRARDNFYMEGAASVNKLLIYAMAKVKKAAAMTWAKLTPERVDVFKHIALAADSVSNGRYDDMFIVPALQGGAGTSTNMNVNEVVCNLALTLMGHNPGEYEIIHPLDDVNKGQSTNDVYPTGLRIAAIDLLRKVSDECAKLQEALQIRENEFESIEKLGRTELMDAVPITLGEEFGAYAQAIARDRWRIYKIEERLRQVNIGGEAVGLSAHSMRKYRFGVIETLREISGIGLAASEYPMDITQNNDVFVEVSGLLKSMAVNLSKISGDLRLMNSGPYGGLGEITLSPLQMGSTIMPGKVNPVIPEFVTEASIKVMANDLSITIAASRGEFELNAFLPLIAESLLESLSLMQTSAKALRENSIETLIPNITRCRALLEGSLAIASSYVPILGYDKVYEAIKLHSDNTQKIKEELKKALDNLKKP